MSALPTRLACLELAELILEAEFDRTGTEPATSARALSLATALQEAIETWVTTHTDDRPATSARALSLATAIQEAIETWQIAQAIEAGEVEP